MKKSTKTILIIALLCIVAGLSCVIVSLALGAMNGDGFWLFSDSSSAATEHLRDFEDASAVKAVVISETGSDVIIDVSPDDSIHVKYHELRNKKYSVELSHSGTLSISCMNSEKWYENISLSFGFSDDDTSLTLSLPEGMYCDLDTETVSGDIRILSGGLRGGSLRLDATSGDIDLRACDFESASISTVSGEISLSDVIFTGDMTLSTTSGDIELSRPAVYGTSLISTTSGDIEFETFSSGNVQLETVSGDIEGSFWGKAGEYDIVTDTVSGELDIEHGLGTSYKTLTVKTVSGDADISFKQ